jgi:chemotaxis methyl-accepting protein methylase
MMDFDGFLRQACPPLDLQWRKYRRRAARRRVLARMRELGLEDFPPYLKHLENHPEESAALADRMPVTVSRFFRDRACWKELAATVLRPAVEARSDGEPFRAWSAGCCGGEEPYTLVMLWRYLAEPRGRDVPLEVTATDIDRASLDRAAAARYERSSLREVPPHLLKRWFRKEKGLWQLDPRVLREVNLRETNLATDPLPQGQDLVLCRYLVFTYYRGARRLEAARRIAASLTGGGVLFIGKKEGLGPDERELFEPLSEGCGIYRKRENI